MQQVQLISADRFLKVKHLGLLRPVAAQAELDGLVLIGADRELEGSPAIFVPAVGRQAILQESLRNGNGGLRILIEDNEGAV